MEVNGLIDHTNLKQNATAEDIKKLCAEAKQYKFATVAINSCWVSLAHAELEDSGVGITSCIGDIKAVVEAAGTVPVKVILECCLLDDEQIVRACKDCMAAGAAFVKTSTGFSTGGATVHDVALMKQTVGNTCKVKAAGGIHNKADAEAMVAAGADRLGCSSGIAIVTE